MKNLTVDIQDKSGGTFIVILAGPLDTYTHETLDFYIERILQPSTNVIIFNMAEVDYISSMGVGSIFKIRKFAKENNVEFRMVAVQSPVQKVLDTVQAMPQTSIFKDHAEMDEYLNDIQRKAKE